MSTKKRSSTAVPACLLMLCLGLGPAILAQTQASPDNSATNKTQNQSRTADQQKNDASDRALTAKIRRAVVAGQVAVHVRPQRKDHCCGRSCDPQGAGPL